jgi:hypothetical protein
MEERSGEIDQRMEGNQKKKNENVHCIIDDCT